MVTTIGIDIGSQKTILVADDGEIVRTSTGSVSFPTLISYHGHSPRYIGDEATIGDTIISLLSFLIGKTADEIKSSQIFSQNKLEILTKDNVTYALVKYGDTVEEISITALLGLYIFKLHDRISQVYGNEINLAFAIPTNVSKSVSFSNIIHILEFIFWFYSFQKHFLMLVKLLV